MWRPARSSPVSGCGTPPPARPWPGLADWLIERPLKVVVILLGAVVVNRLVKRAIDRHGQPDRRNPDHREESAAEVEVRVIDPSG